jgi:hypothetical protein
MGVGLLGLGCWMTTGCMDTVPDWAQPRGSFSNDISTPGMPSFVRPQVAEGPAVKLQSPMPVDTQPLAAPPPDSGVIQTSALVSRGTVRVSIRAWVNGQPIFDEEVRQLLGPALNGFRNMPEPQRSTEVTKTMNNIIDRIVDQELMFQDAIKRLKQASPHSLDKLNDFVDQEFNKTVKRMRDAHVSEREIREVEPIARRMMRRELVANEYARTLIKPLAERVNMEDIREYYETHKNEFVTVDRLEWQDIFIKLSPNLPTVEEARHFGEELINRCRTPDDFNRLMVYNEGVTKNSGGEGLGNLKGQIQPRELEEPLFKLREGEIGPVVALTTGIHLIRVTRREYAGQRPMDYEVQKQIRKKLENELADREYKRMVRELRARATIRVERDAP